MSGRGVAALRAFAQRAPAERAERCDVCGSALGAAHDHVVRAGGFELICACRSCAIAPPAGGRAVASKLERLPVVPSAPTWSALGVPVALAFLVRTGDKLIARYPGPAGATAAEIDAAATTRLASEVPAITSLIPEIEAILVDRRRGVAYRASIDWCFELTGLLKRRDEAGVDAFFERLAREAADA